MGKNNFYAAPLDDGRFSLFEKVGKFIVCIGLSDELNSDDLIYSHTLTMFDDCGKPAKVYELKENIRFLPPIEVEKIGD